MCNNSAKKNLTYERGIALCQSRIPTHTAGDYARKPFLATPCTYCSSNTVSDPQPTIYDQGGQQDQGGRQKLFQNEDRNLPNSTGCGVEPPSQDYIVQKDIQAFPDSVNATQHIKLLNQKHKLWRHTVQWKCKMPGWRHSIGLKQCSSMSRTVIRIQASSTW